MSDMKKYKKSKLISNIKEMKKEPVMLFGSSCSSCGKVMRSP